MSGVFNKALQLLIGTDGTSPSVFPKKNQRPLQTLSERDLIRLESEIGAELFGPIPAENRREFFCLDENTWIWYEEWVDVETGKKKTATTRYEVHEKGILKVQEGARYNIIAGKELDNLLLAAQMYYEQVARNIYKTDPETGQKLR